MGRKRAGRKMPKPKPELCPKAVVKMADELRAEFHKDIEDARIAYVFVPKGLAKHGRVSLGSAKKESDAHRLVSGVNFIVRLSLDKWNSFTLEQQRAVLDHELCHCAAKYDDKTAERVGWKVRGHDLEEFGEVIERHGLYLPDRKAFVENAARQLEMKFKLARKHKKAG